MAWKVIPEDVVEFVLLPDREWHQVRSTPQGRSSFKIAWDGTHGNHFMFSEVLHNTEYVVRGPAESVLAVRIRRSQAQSKAN